MKIFKDICILGFLVYWTVMCVAGIFDAKNFVDVMIGVIVWCFGVTFAGLFLED